MKKLLLSIAAAVLTIVGLGGVATMSPAYAVRCMDGKEPTTGKMEDCPEYAGFEQKDDLAVVVKNGINVVIGVVGFVAVAMMIMGGISFIISQGDSGKVTKARNTILYGVVGLVIAVLAFAIVNFVLTSLF